MTIIVTGTQGQLATALRARGAQCVGRPDLDFDRPDSIARAFRAAAPHLVVNAAAWTAVDAAEAEQDAAYRANRDAPAVLAALCAEHAVPLIHISTDYVFDGSKGAPYAETDPPCPASVYGASKLAGEQAVLASGAQAVILRTSWVYGAHGRNFVRTMLGARSKPVLRVVADQRGCPTDVDDLADAITGIAARIATGWQPQFGGVFHAAGSGETTWHGLAQAVFARAATHGLPVPDVQPIATADWPTPARRPADSRLDCGKLHDVFGLRLPDWHGSVARVVDRVLATESVRP